MITDLEVSYKVIDAVKLTAGANNLFNVYPDRVNAFLRDEYLRNNSNAYVTQYPTFSPFGINGGYYYGKVTVTLLTLPDDGEGPRVRPRPFRVRRKPKKKARLAARPSQREETPQRARPVWPSFAGPSSDGFTTTRCLQRGAQAAGTAPAGWAPAPATVAAERLFRGPVGRLAPRSS